MRGQLERTDLVDEDRLHFDFALGKALEDEGDVRRSPSGTTSAATRCAWRGRGYDADETTDHVQRSKALFTPEFFAERAGMGCPAPDPIFIVGLPRAGSTLVEQILSSHSEVEGTMELPDIIAMSRVARRPQDQARGVAVPRGAGDARRERFSRVGRAVPGRHPHRSARRGRPFFIDKMPNNFAHIGLIHLILPNAKIIDARRHPLACCFSNFKQQFARGQNFTYSLEDIGRYYRDYVELMAHFDAVLPGRIHRVFYESHGRGHRRRGPPAARLLRPAVRGRVPALLRERARGTHRELGAGAKPDLSRRP